MSDLTGNVTAFFNGLPIPTIIKYFPNTDPYAIVFVFYTPEPVVWTFARDLLVEGLEVPCGDGDVNFRPAGEHIIMSLSSDNGRRAEFSFLRTDMVAVVEIAETMMPRGKESENINWDDELETLLNGNG